MDSKLVGVVTLQGVCVIVMLFCTPETRNKKVINKYIN